MLNICPTLGGKCWEYFDRLNIAEPTPFLCITEPTHTPSPCQTNFISMYYRTTYYRTNYLSNILPNQTPTGPTPAEPTNFPYIAESTSFPCPTESTHLHTLPSQKQGKTRPDQLCQARLLQPRPTSSDIHP